MSDFPEHPDWWKATDERWYPPPASDDREPPAASRPPAEVREAERQAEQKKIGRGCMVGVVVVFLLIVAASIIGGGGDEGEDEPSGGDLRAGAFDVCTQFVEERLRAPGSASFPNQFQDDGEVVIVGGASAYTVRSHVDAENGFGGQVRTDFVCEVRHVEGENWRLIDLQLG